MGRSRSGLTTKVTALPCDRHAAPDRGIAVGALLGDRAFDVNQLGAERDTRCAAAVIPPKANGKAKFDCGRDTYRRRHLIENLFAKLARFHVIATRHAKIDISLRASISPAAAIASR
jgi:transposase